MRSIFVSLMLLAMTGCATQSTVADSTPGAKLAPTQLPQVAGLKTADSINRPPKAVAARNPVYPLALRKRGIEAVVSVVFVVGVDGLVHDIQVLNSPDKLFDAAIIAALADWRYEPGLKNGKPMKVKLKMPITFAL